jgi:hypothetical protein
MIAKITALKEKNTDDSNELISQIMDDYSRDLTINSKDLEEGLNKARNDL